METAEIDRILEKLVKDVEMAVHALYRGETRQDTQKARSGRLLQAAKSALGAAVARPPGGTSGSASVGPGWSTGDRDAVVKCIQAWQPMGGPTSTAPGAPCVAGGRMLVPTWAERETARNAVRKITQS